MSIRENIQFFHHVNIEKYMNVLRTKYGVKDHPAQENSFLIENGPPFYKPQQIEDHVSILGFNNTPLPDFLLQALIDHPELAPDDVIIRWTQEQDMVLEATLGELRSQSKKGK